MFVSIPDFHRTAFKMQILFAIGLSVSVLVQPQPTSILQCVHLKSKKKASADKTPSGGKAEPEEKSDDAINRKIQVKTGILKELPKGPKTSILVLLLPYYGTQSKSNINYTL